MPAPVVLEELNLLDRVEALIGALPPPTVPSEAPLVAELEELRRTLRDAKTEDRAALLQQWDRYALLLRQLRTAERPPGPDPESPYFAHMRLREAGAEHDILLGKSTCMLRGLPIVDWRNAPVSRVFYRYRQGEEYEEEIAGRPRAGEVAVRRTVAIRGRRLERVEGPEGVFRTDPDAPDGWSHVAAPAPRLGGGEGAALRAHEVGAHAGRRLGTDTAGTRRRADKHLPDIAGLIDPQQFDLVTRPSPGFLVVRGVAGSGKTTVALHRIAYLAYDDPSIDSGRTMVVVFSPALRDYVSHVLPALGVHRVAVRTFQDWASEQCRRLFPLLPRRLREDTPAGVQRLKLHPTTLAALEAHVRRTPGPATAAQAMDDWTSVLANRALLEEAFARMAPDAFGPEALARAVDWCRRRAEELGAWRGGEPGDEPEIDAEDQALLLRAWQLRVGPLPARAPRAHATEPLRYRHLAIDEVQDFSPLEVRVLLDCLDDRRSVTLAGDTQQHVVEHGGFTSWADFLARLGISGAEVQTLDTSYRCTHEVAAFAVGLLGDLREDLAPPRTVRGGPPVELFRFTDHGACVAHLAAALTDLILQEPLASIAVLAPTREIAALYHRGLETAEVPRVRLVAHQNFTFAPGVEVTDIEQVKGLEFDYVILVEASTSEFPDTPASRRRLHVGASRAIHQLWVTSVGTPAGAVRSVLSLPVAASS